MMRRLLPAATALTFGALLASATPAQSIPPQEYREVPGEMEFSGRMIASPLPDANGEVDREAVRQALQRFRILEHNPDPDRYVFELGEDQRENPVARALMDTGLFLYVEPDWTVYPVGCPNDTRLNSQWHHDPGIMDSCVGWDTHTGRSPITVAICDTGVRTTHEDLRANRREGYNAVNRVWERQGGQIGPVASHGTQTTGCAAAVGNNGKGVSGVGWNLWHRMMRVSNSASGSSSISTLVHGAETGILAGDKVASVSYSGVNSSSVRQSATRIKSWGGLLVWAAGNDGSRLNWGNRDADDVIVVGATDSRDTLASFSAYGPSMDLVAPGVSVYTTDAGFDTDYAAVSGTSFATPLTSGLCALIWSADPTLTPNQVEAILKAGVDDLGSSGQDDTYGYGRIDVAGAMAQMPGPVRGGLQYLFSSDIDATIGGVVAEDDDVLLFDMDTSSFSLYFDASDVLTANDDLDAIHQLPDGSLLMSFRNALNVTGVGTVEDEDIVRFVPTSLGNTTAGTFSLYFDGSDVGLSGTTEDVNGLSVNGSGDLVLTTSGPFSVTGASGKNEDIFLFRPTSLGANTAGTFSFLFDGTDPDAKLGKPGEQLIALHFDQASGAYFFSTANTFKVPPKALTGEDEDVLCFDVYTTGTNTTGFMIWSLDGSVHGLGPIDIDALQILD